MSTNTYLIVQDHACSGEQFSLVFEDGSTLLRTMPVPKNLDSYYQDNYISHKDRADGIISALYLSVKRIMLNQKIRWLRNWCPGGKRVLDFGAGTGEFVAAASSHGWTARGTEPNDQARNNARSKGLDVHADLEEVHDSYDVITLWHVLEHTPDPEATLRDLEKILNTEGAVVIALPNYQSLDAEIYQSVWAAYDVPRHLYHFDRSAIVSLMRSLGYSLVDEKPLWFDAFYVSIISEKFRSNGGNIFRGIWNGFRSNLSALRTGEYSSLTYVFRKDLF